MTQIKAPTPSKKLRVKKSDWLNTALDVLRDQGIEAVRVERLAARLNVSKSGFYYHFRDRPDLCTALIEHWKNVDGVPSSRRDLSEQNPEDLLLEIVEIVYKLDLGRLDFAVRQWSQSDLEVAKIYRAEVRSRLSYITRIISMLGFEGDDLSMRVRTFVAYTTTERQFFPDLSSRERKRHWSLRIKMLSRRD